MPRPTPERLAKLPAWAQDYIELLHRDLGYARRDAAVDWQDEETEFCVERTDFSVDSPPLTNHYFPLKSGDDVCVGGIRVTLRDGKCYVTAHEGGLAVLPDCANVVTIEGIDR